MLEGSDTRAAIERPSLLDFNKATQKTTLEKVQRALPVAAYRMPDVTGSIPEAVRPEFYLYRGLHGSRENLAYTRNYTEVIENAFVRPLKVHKNNVADRIVITGPGHASLENQAGNTGTVVCTGFTYVVVILADRVLSEVVAIASIICSRHKQGFVKIDIHIVGGSACPG